MVETRPHRELYLEKISQAIFNKGYAVFEHFLPDSTICALHQLATEYYSAGHMIEAKIGKNKTQHNTTNTSVRNSEIRGDSTFWLDENIAHIAVQDYLEHMQALRIALNQSLFLNLQTFETHFAVYPIGAYYQKHLDQFTHINNVRKVSSVLYLNQTWSEIDGGELRLYHGVDNYLDILPTRGKLVLFLSDQFWHEVLPTKRERVSLTGWFRTRENVLI